MRAASTRKVGVSLQQTKLHYITVGKTSKQRNNSLWWTTGGKEEMGRGQKANMRKSYGNSSHCSSNTLKEFKLYSGCGSQKKDEL